MTKLQKIDKKRQPRKSGTVDLNVLQKILFQPAFKYC